MRGEWCCARRKEGVVGLEGAGETEGSRIWGMRASWLMITGGSGGRSNAQRDRLELCPRRRAVTATREVASEMMHAFVDSGRGRWAKRQD